MKKSEERPVAVEFLEEEVSPPPSYSPSSAVSEEPPGSEEALPKMIAEASRVTSAAAPKRSTNKVIVVGSLTALSMSAAWLIYSSLPAKERGVDDLIASAPPRSMGAELERAVAAAPGLSSAIILVATISAILAIFAYLILIGSRSVRKLRQEALQEAERLYLLININAPIVVEYETRMAQRLQTIPAAKMRALGALKRILRAIEQRLREVEPYLSSWRLGEVERASLMLKRSLIVEESVFDCVIDSEELPPLDTESVGREIERLVKTLAD